MIFRKLLVSFWITALALVLTVGMVYAGNTADIEQDGRNNLAEIDQEGSENVGVIYQGGNNDRAYIDQIGDRNDAWINQVGGNISSEGRVIQEGNDNIGHIENQTSWSSPGSEAWIEQYGNENLAEIGQYDHAHDASIYQDGDENKATIEQRNSGHFAMINQFGDFNEAYVTQRGKNHSSNIYQDGNSNLADVAQTGDDSLAVINQLGDNNIIAGVENNDGLTFDPSKEAESISSEFNGRQIGNNNDIGLYQLSSVGTITQEGDSNEALLYQGGTGGHTSTILQTGNNNTGHVKQTVVGHVGDITQTGNMNTALINQF